MKKLFYLGLIALSLMFFVGCQKNGELKDKLNKSETAAVYGIVPELIPIDEPDTKGIYVTSDAKIDFKWLADFDAINVFSDNKGEVMSYLVKSVKENPRYCDFEVKDFSLKEGVQYYSFFPTTRSLDPKAVVVDYTSQRQLELNDGSHLSEYSFLVSKPVIAKEGNDAYFEYAYHSGFIRFVITPYTDFIAQKITLKSDTPDAFVTKGKIDVTTEKVTADKTSATMVLYLGEDEEGLDMVGGFEYNAYMAVNNPIDIVNLTATISGVDNEGNPVSFSRVISDNAKRHYGDGTTGRITITQEAPQPEETESDITGTTVDLGEWK